jgi:hypothetical protein
MSSSSFCKNVFTAIPPPKNKKKTIYNKNKASVLYLCHYVKQKGHFYFKITVKYDMP